MTEKDPNTLSSNESVEIATKAVNAFSKYEKKPEQMDLTD